MYSTIYHNPYYGNDFFEFFITLYNRLPFIFRSLDWYSDEIQVVSFILLGISCSFIGCWLVAKQMTMLANSLSHTVLVGIIMAFYCLNKHTPIQNLSDIPFHYLLLAALMSGILTVSLIEISHKLLKVQKDAANGITFTFLFALGIILATTLTKNVHIGIEAIMGNADMLSIIEVKRLSYTTIINGLFCLAFFRPLFLSSFDLNFAQSINFFPKRVDSLLLLLTALTAIIGFRAVGVILLLGFLVIPPLLAQLYVTKMKNLIITSILFSFLSSLLGVALSNHFLFYYNIPLSTGGVVTVLMSLTYLITLSVKYSIKRIRKL